MLDLSSTTARIVFAAVMVAIAFFLFFPISWLAISAFKGNAEIYRIIPTLYPPEPTLMPGGMYRNGFWFPYPRSDVFLALGIHGQMVYVNRAAGVVAAKLSSWPTPQDGERLLWTIRAFDAVARTIG